MREILDGLPIHKLFGVGRKTLPAVHAAGIHTFADLRLAGEEVLWRAFGKHGRSMRERACGVDDRPVQPDREEKSISAEETFAADIDAAATLQAEISRLADKAASRLRAHDLAAGTVSVKIRRKDFTTYTRQRALRPPTQDTAVIAAAARALLDAWMASQPRTPVRLLGVGMSDLQRVRQADLFAGPAAQGQRLDSAVDGIRSRFGEALVTRASLLPRTGVAPRTPSRG
jgi:DNA polymerase-4